MNERIQKLAEQAGLKYYNWINNVSNINDGDFTYPRLEDYEKFAELIVKECLEQVRDEVQYEYDWKLADAVSKRVLEHFGVGE